MSSPWGGCDWFGGQKDIAGIQRPHLCRPSSWRKMSQFVVPEKRKGHRVVGRGAECSLCVSNFLDLGPDIGTFTFSPLKGTAAPVLI